MGFTWATDGAAVVTEPSAGLKLLGYVAGQKPTAGNFNWLFQQVAGISTKLAYVFEGVGSLVSMIGYDLGAVRMVAAFTISSIDIVCPDTPASGTIEFELFKVTPGGAVTSLYTSNPLPTLTCNGGYAAATIDAGSLPNTVALSAGDLLIARLTDAPGDAIDIRISVS